MPFISGDLGDADLDLDSSIAREGDGSAFAPIKPGRYTAVVQSMGHKTYRASFAGITNTDSADGKWEYMGLTPKIVLANEFSTAINRQDFTLGILKDNKLFRPDGDKTKTPVFGGQRGALYMLMALGLVSQDGKNFSVGFDPEMIKNRVVVVTTNISAYKKGSNDQWDAATLKARFDEIKPDWTVDDIHSMMETVNEQEGVEDTSKAGWRVKNIITGFYRLSEEEAVAKGYVVEGMQVFVNQSDLDEFRKGGKGVAKAPRKNSL